MGTNTTGSLVHGLKDGMDLGVGTGSLGPMPGIVQFTGNPSGVYTVQVGSDIGIDSVAGSIYMGLAAGGESWIALGSTTF